MNTQRAVDSGTVDTKKHPVGDTGPARVLCPAVETGLQKNKTKCKINGISQKGLKPNLSPRQPLVSLQQPLRYFDAGPLTRQPLDFGGSSLPSSSPQSGTEPSGYRRGRREIRIKSRVNSALKRLVIRTTTLERKAHNLRSQVPYWLARLADA